MYYYDLYIYRNNRGIYCYESIQMADHFRLYARYSLGGDIRRTYSRIVLEWLHYMEHLKEDYPYLFSLAMRTNPFDPEAKVEVG